MKYNLIFPIAGEGSRFGYTFKPFLEVDNKGNFIELAFSPFKKHLSKIDKILFIFLKAQETKYDVSNNLKRIFSNINFETCILDKPTSGPAETIRLALKKHPLKGPLIICDCDHTLNVDNIFKEIEESKADCIIPIWPLSRTPSFIRRSI